MYFSQHDVQNDLITIQASFQKQISILQNIAKLDSALREESAAERPDMAQITLFLNEKDKLLSSLNDESEKSSMFLSAIAPYLSSPSLKNSPAYRELRNLIDKTSLLMEQVCDKEDFDIFHIKKNLEDFRQILIKEFSMKDIPLTNRQIIL